MIKKLLLVAVVASMGLSSCNKNVCPAYSKANTQRATPLGVTASTSTSTAQQ